MTIRKATKYASGAVTPEYEVVNWMVNRMAVAGAIWVIPCISTPDRPRAPERSLPSVEAASRMVLLSVEFKFFIESTLSPPEHQVNCSAESVFDSAAFAGHE